MDPKIPFGILAPFELVHTFLPEFLRAPAIRFEVVVLPLVPVTIITGTPRELMATVEGDVHDIGKNIVSMLLENNGYEVIDLGRNVKTERIIEEAIKNKVDFVGLSALMTTTVTEMEHVIKELKKHNLKVFSMVGGAVVTDDYAKSINADIYAKNAMEAVEKIKQYLSRPISGNI